MTLYEDLTNRALRDPIQSKVISKLHETLDHFQIKPFHRGKENREKIAEVLLRMRAPGYKFQTLDAKFEVIGTMFDHFKDLLQGLPEAKYMLFIYGTLKRGFPLHQHLARQTFISDVKMTGYRMFTHSKLWYPVLTRDESCGLEIEGELWEVTESCLAKLDQVEGNSFVRKYVDLQAPEDTELVETYLYRYKLGKDYVDCGACWIGPDDNDCIWV